MTIDTIKRTLTDRFSAELPDCYERRIIFWNKAAERITGYSAEEMIGKQCFESKLDHIDLKRLSAVL